MGDPQVTGAQVGVAAGGPTTRKSRPRPEGLRDGSF
jgi:hypothetical protein